MAEQEIEDPIIPEWIDHPQVIEGRKWIVGRGTPAADVMIIGEFPGKAELSQERFFVGPAGAQLGKQLFDAGVKQEDCYFTNVVKFRPEKKKPSAKEVKLCLPLLLEEIKRIKPKVIVTMGTASLQAVLGKTARLSGLHGAIVTDCDLLDDVIVVPMYNPSYVLHKPDAKDEVDADWRIFKKVVEGVTECTVDTNYVVYRKHEEIKAFGEWLFASGEKRLIVIDAEWDGIHWQDPKGYIRTIQLGYATGEVAQVEFYDEQGNCIVNHLGKCWRELNTILTHPLVQLCGHNIRADGQWIATYGINIRPHVVYDTMIAEHTINGAAKFALENVTTKYTEMGRYDLELVEWKAENPQLWTTGYGQVPRDILLPYGAKDVDGPRRIMEAQLPLLEPFMEPRGEYPSIWEVDMHAQDVLYEPEGYGLLVDKVRLGELTTIYQAARSELAGRITVMANAVGAPDFNPGSHAQVRKLLFDTLALTPVMTTANKPWSSITMLPREAQTQINPSTNKESMSILADMPTTHPIVGLLRDYRKVDYVCNQWLCDPHTSASYDASSTRGGLVAKIWPDGRLHARFSQLKETARFGSSKPNVQNWMKRAEGELQRIIEKDLKLVEKHLGEGTKFPKIRSAIIPTPGHVIMEADWKQAEMFVLARLSGDARMWDALTTPGRDLHDLTAIEAFGITVYDPDGNVVPDQLLLDMAGADPNWDADDSEFAKFQNSLLYVDQRGRELTRKAFKSGIRVSAKNLNFGIPYGRGAQDIAIQVKAETGSTESIHKLKEDIELMMSVWKTKTYPDAWRYMEQCALTVTDPGYIKNPWGRPRNFPDTHDREMIAKMGREAQNFPIQSTVADTCLIALHMMTEYRKKYGLNFRIINQIHDAILIESPIEEIEASKTMFHATMGNIQIPMPDGEPLCLGIDIDVMERWAS